MRKLIFIILLLNSCTWPLKVDTKPVERLPLALSNPQPLSLQDIQWKILQDDTKVFFALDEQSYKALASNLAEIRNYIILQKSILAEYRKYYESAK